MGAGSRAMAMGGANIALADNATAASWNPGCLGIIDERIKFQFAYVLSYYNRSENEFSEREGTDCSGVQVAEPELNYLSVVRAGYLFGKKVCFSVNYQQMYDLNREIEIKTDFGDSDNLSEINYSQKGSLYALGVAFNARLTYKLHLGGTINYWGNVFGTNSWSLLCQDRSNDYLYAKKDKFELKGWNYVIGLHYKLFENLFLGVVVKTPFTANIEHKLKIDYTSFSSDITPISEPKFKKTYVKMDMPLSYGAGLAYKVQRNWYITADIYRTHWDQLKYIDEKGIAFSPLSAKNIDQSHIEPLVWYRAGTEYEIEFAQKKFLQSLKLRSGLFYDPAPRDNGKDTIYGVSCGVGFILKRFVFDIAYQYRFGDDVMNSNIEVIGPEDMKENYFYTCIQFR